MLLVPKQQTTSTLHTRQDDDDLKSPPDGYYNKYFAVAVYLLSIYACG